MEQQAERYGVPPEVIAAVLAYVRARRHDERRTK
jgi:hypothetical protein